MKQLTMAECAAFLLQHDNFCIVTHRRPDGDTIGCAAALCRGLRSRGKQAVIFENAQFTPKFQPYLDGLTAAQIPADATLISVDIATAGLFPFNWPENAGEIVLAIDHHGSNTGFARATCLHPEVAACGEIIFSLLELLEIDMDKAMADAIYMAISTDTGCFRFSNTTPNTLQCAARCMQLGADTVSINKIMFMTRRFNRLQLESYLTKTAEFYHDGAVCICALPNAIRAQLALTEDDIDDISGFPRDIEGVRIGAMLREEETGKGKISLRTAPGVNASEICGKLGGGGHAAAAGAAVAGGIDGAREAILSAISAYLTEHPL